jgi:hypothetical protein
MKWIEFKTIFKNWKFDTASKGKFSMIKEKNIKIWNFIGD